MHATDHTQSSPSERPVRRRRWAWHWRVLVQVQVALILAAIIGIGLLRLAASDIRRVATQADAQSYAIAWTPEARWKPTSAGINTSDWLIIHFAPKNPLMRTTNLMQASWSLRNREVSLRAPTRTYAGTVTWGSRDRASDVIRGLYYVLENAETGSVTVTLTIRGSVNPAATSTRRHRIAFQRPDRLAWTVEGDLSNDLATFIEYDLLRRGQTLRVYGPVFGIIGRFEHLDRSGPVDDRLLELARHNANPFPEEIWKGPEPLIETAARLEHLGTEPINGVNCHHIRCDTLDAWITTDERPLLRRVNIQSGWYIYDFVDWQLDEPVPEEVFEFVPEHDGHVVEAWARKKAQLEGR